MNTPPLKFLEPEIVSTNDLVISFFNRQINFSQSLDDDEDIAVEGFDLRNTCIDLTYIRHVKNIKETKSTAFQSSEMNAVFDGIVSNIRESFTLIDRCQKKNAIYVNGCPGSGKSRLLASVFKHLFATTYNNLFCKYISISHRQLQEFCTMIECSQTVYNRSNQFVSAPVSVHTLASLITSNTISINSNRTSGKYLIAVDECAMINKTDLRRLISVTETLCAGNTIVYIFAGDTNQCKAIERGSDDSISEQNDEYKDEESTLPILDQYIQVIGETVGHRPTLLTLTDSLRASDDPEYRQFISEYTRESDVLRQLSIIQNFIIHTVECGLHHTPIVTFRPNIDYCLVFTNKVRAALTTRILDRYRETYPDHCIIPTADIPLVPRILYTSRGGIRNGRRRSGGSGTGARIGRESIFDSLEKGDMVLVHQIIPKGDGRFELKYITKRLRSGKMEEEVCVIQNSPNIYSGLRLSCVKSIFETQGMTIDYPRHVFIDSRYASINDIYSAITRMKSPRRQLKGFITERFVWALDSWHVHDLATKNTNNKNDNCTNNREACFSQKRLKRT